jgi:hypothetical protein
VIDRRYRVINQAARSVGLVLSRHHMRDDIAARLAPHEHHHFTFSQYSTKAPPSWPTDSIAFVAWLGMS